MVQSRAKCLWSLGFDWLRKRRQWVLRIMLSLANIIVGGGRHAAEMGRIRTNPGAGKAGMIRNVMEVSVWDTTGKAPSSCAH